MKVERDVTKGTSTRVWLVFPWANIENVCGLVTIKRAFFFTKCLKKAFSPSKKPCIRGFGAAWGVKNAPVC